MSQSPKHFSRCSVASLWLITSLSHAEQQTATPYRPTVSNPPELSALHHVEVEFGTQLNQPSEQEQRSSLPYLIKYPFHKNWGLLIAGDAWVETKDALNSTNGLGNTAVLLKHYYPINETLAIGFEAGVSLPTARQPLGSGRTDYVSNFIVGKDIDDLRIDVNFGVTRQGYKEANYSRFAYAWQIAASHPITERWGIAGEFSGVFYPQQRATSQFLVTLNYAVIPQLVMDFGSAVGMTNGSDDYIAFVGFVWLIED